MGMKIDDDFLSQTNKPIVVICARSLKIIQSNHSFQQLINLPDTGLRGFYFPDLLNNSPVQNDKLAEYLLYSNKDHLFEIFNGHSESLYVYLNALKIQAEEKDAILLTIDPASRFSVNERTDNSPESKDNYTNEYYSQLFFILTPEGRYKDWNSELEKVTGYSPDEISTMHPTDFFREDLKTVVEGKMAEVFENGKAELQAPILTKRGKEIIYHFFAKKVDINQAPHLIGLAIDISHKDKVLEDQYFRKKFYKKLIDNTDAIVYVKDAEGRYQFINLAFKNLFGLTDEDLLGLSDNEIIIGNQLQPIRRADRDVIENKNPIKQEEKITIDGKTRYFLTQKTPILAPSGTDHWLCGISTEITNRKETELTLKKLLDERDVLLQEVHHRVNNNLEIINALIYFQIQEVDNKDVKDELRYCKSRIKSMAAVHRLLYESENFSTINLKKIILRLTDQIRATIDSEEKLQISMSIEPIELNVNQAIPCVLIINELLTMNLYRVDTDYLKGKLKMNVFENDDNVNVKIFFKNIKKPSSRNKSKDKKLFSNIIHVFLEQINAQLHTRNHNSERAYSFRFKKREIRGTANHFLQDKI